MVIDSFAANETFVPRGTPLPPLVSPKKFQEMRVEWCMFFSSVYSLQEHPGMSKQDANPKSIGECAVIADKMVYEYLKRMEFGL